MDTIFVINLPYACTADELRLLCSQFGTVENVTIAKDRETGASRGFGFVQFSSSNDAVSAQRALQGYTFQGRKLKTDMAKASQQTRA